MNPYSTELAHHGILGQRWGKKNGPPYPLDAEDHSSSEKKARWRKSLEGKVQGIKKKYDGMSDRNKTIAKRAGIAAATLTAISVAQTARNVKIQNYLQSDYGKVPISVVLTKGGAAAGRAAAIAALATVGAHKLKDAWDSLDNENKSK